MRRRMAMLSLSCGCLSKLIANRLTPIFRELIKYRISVVVLSPCLLIRSAMPMVRRPFHCDRPGSVAGASKVAFCALWSAAISRRFRIFVAGDAMCVARPEVRRTWRDSHSHAHRVRLCACHPSRYRTSEKVLRTECQSGDKSPQSKESAKLEISWTAHLGSAVKGSGRAAPSRRMISPRSLWIETTPARRWSSPLR
jgi:hypothetical protein